MKKTFGSMMLAGVAGVVAMVAIAGCGKKETKESATGIPECDAYVARLEACLSKTPAEGRAAQEAIIKAQREQFKQQASDPMQKAGIKYTCKTQNDAWAKANPDCG